MPFCALPERFTVVYSVTVSIFTMNPGTVESALQAITFDLKGQSVGLY